MCQAQSQAIVGRCLQSRFCFAKQHLAAIALGPWPEGCCARACPCYAGALMNAALPSLVRCPVQAKYRVMAACGDDTRLYSSPLVKFSKACTQVVSGRAWYLSGEHCCC